MCLGILKVRDLNSFDDRGWKKSKASGLRLWIAAVSDWIWSPSANLYFQRERRTAHIVQLWVVLESGREVKEESSLPPAWTLTSVLRQRGEKIPAFVHLFASVEGGREAGRGAVHPARPWVLCATQQVWGEAPLPGWMRMWMRMPPLLSWPCWEPEQSHISQQQASNSWKQASAGRGHGTRMGMVWE